MPLCATYNKLLNFLARSTKRLFHTVSWAVASKNRHVEPDSHRGKERAGIAPQQSAMVSGGLEGLQGIVRPSQRSSVVLHGVEVFADIPDQKTPLRRKVEEMYSQAIRKLFMPGERAVLAIWTNELSLVSVLLQGRRAFA